MRSKSPLGACERNCSSNRWSPPSASRPSTGPPCSVSPSTFSAGQRELLHRAWCRAGWPLQLQRQLLELERRAGHVQTQPRQAELAAIDLPAQPRAAELQLHVVEIDMAVARRRPAIAEADGIGLQPRIEALEFVALAAQLQAGLLQP